MKKILIAIVFSSSLLFLGASCYKSSSNSTSSTPVATNQVTMSSMAFNPSTITVSPGTTVTWTNQDSTTHTVTSDNNTFSSDRLSPGNNFQFTFNNAGTFSYHCSIHTSMKGQVTVK